MSNTEPRLRADARRNVERICAAATAAFAEHGLDVPLDDIARDAGVSIGTIYNRFGGRNGLLEAVVHGVAEEKLEAAIASSSGETAWDRFASYVLALGSNQAEDLPFNDVISNRHPEAPKLLEVCNRAIAFGESLIVAAQAEGSLRPDVTATDLERLIWLNAQAVRAEDDWWARLLNIVLDGLYTGGVPHD